MLCLLITKAVVLSSVFLLFITVGVTVGELDVQLLAWSDGRGSLSLLGILSCLSPSKWCFTIISSNVFKGEFWACNNREVSSRLVFHVIHIPVANIQLQDLLYYYYRAPPCVESASSGICCWYSPLCEDVLRPYRQSSSWDPAYQQSFTLYSLKLQV